MGTLQLSRKPLGRGQFVLAAIKCTLTEGLRALRLYAAGTRKRAACLWRKLSLTWDLDFSNLPIADYTMLPTQQPMPSTTNEKSQSLAEAFYACKSKEKGRKTPIFALDWENAWRKQSDENQILMVLRSNKSRPAITEPTHSFYYLLTVRRIGKVLMAEVLYTDDRVKGWLIDREVFSESANLRRLAMQSRAKKYPPGKNFVLRKVDKPATCAML